MAQQEEWVWEGNGDGSRLPARKPTMGLLGSVPAQTQPRACIHELAAQSREDGRFGTAVSLGAGKFRIKLPVTLDEETD